MAKQPIRPADKITVLKKDEKTERRIAVVNRNRGGYEVHASSVMKDESKVIKRGEGSGRDQVKKYTDRGYTKD